MRTLLAAGAAAAALGAALLVWGARQQVAWSECQVHCTGRDPWPVTAVGIALLLGGGFFMAWTAVAEHAGRVLHPLGQDLDERARLRRVGRAAMARVVDATEAGTGPLGDPVMELRLAVEVEGGVPYEVSRRTTVPRDRLERVQPGQALRVLVDPVDPQRLVVEWS